MRARARLAGERSTDVTPPLPASEGAIRCHTERGSVSQVRERRRSFNIATLKNLANVVDTRRLWHWWRPLPRVEWEISRNVLQCPALCMHACIIRSRACRPSSPRQPLPLPLALARAASGDDDGDGIRSVGRSGLKLNEAVRQVVFGPAPPPSLCCLPLAALWPSSRAARSLARLRRRTDWHSSAAPPPLSSLLLSSPLVPFPSSTTVTSPSITPRRVDRRVPPTGRRRARRLSPAECRV